MVDPAVSTTRVSFADIAKVFIGAKNGVTLGLPRYVLQPFIIAVIWGYEVILTIKTMLTA